MAKKPKKIAKQKKELQTKAEPEVADRVSEKNIPTKKTKIRVIGIGGGGGNIVSELAQRVQRATFFVANTDLKALKETSRKVERFSFGENLTHGLGTGMNPELGETAAQNDKEKIKKILRGQDLVILIASLGGGVGSGASQVFAQISKNLGNLTYGIFTLPFKFEGEKKTEIAKNSLEKIKPRLNAMTIIPNERIFQIIDKATPLKSALSAINKMLSDGLEGLIETIYEPGLINIDFADLKTILEGRGRLCYLNTFTFSRKEGQIVQAVEKALNSPLYPYSIKGAKAILYNIAGEKEINLEEMKEISKAISEKVNKEAKIIFGISHISKRGDPKYDDSIKITIFATGLSIKTPKPYIGSKPKLIKRKVKKTPPLKKISPPKPSPKIKVKNPKKVKIKITKKPIPQSSKAKPKAEVEEKKENLPIIKSVTIRKNALQIRKETEEAEKEILEKENFWETPAFLRPRPFRRPPTKAES